MPPEPITRSAVALDLSSRFVSTTTVVASPALAAETVIAQTAPLGNLALMAGVFVSGWAAFTVGTSGSAIRLRIRQTAVGGALVCDSGALTGGVAAANLLAQDVEGVDVAAVMPGQVYVLTLQVTAGAAVSTVSAVMLRAIAV